MEIFLRKFLESICMTHRLKFYLRYELANGDEKESSESAIFDELIDWFQVKFLPGGEALTTIRVAQWMLHLPKATTAIGAIGNDSKGTFKILTDKIFVSEN